MRGGRWLFYCSESSWPLFKAATRKCHTTLSLARTHKQRDTTGGEQRLGGIPSSAKLSPPRRRQSEVSRLVSCRPDRAQTDLHDYCSAQEAIRLSCALHFLLIVVRFHYLSVEVITVHLLSLLPASDHSRQPLLVSAHLQVGELLTLQWCQMHTITNSSHNRHVLSSGLTLSIPLQSKNKELAPFTALKGNWACGNSWCLHALHSNRGDQSM